MLYWAETETVPAASAATERLARADNSWVFMARIVAQPRLNDRGIRVEPASFFGVDSKRRTLDDERCRLPPALIPAVPVASGIDEQSVRLLRNLPARRSFRLVSVAIGSASRGAHEFVRHGARLLVCSTLARLAGATTVAARFIVKARRFLGSETGIVDVPTPEGMTERRSTERRKDKRGARTDVTRREYQQLRAVVVRLIERVLALQRQVDDLRRKIRL